MLTSSDPLAAGRAAVDEIEDDRTIDELTAALPDGATVVTIGWPDLIGMAVARRGDVRVLAVDAGHQGSSFVQRLERVEIESELVPTEAAAIAVAAADLVLIEADALDVTTSSPRPARRCSPPPPACTARRCGASPGAAVACRRR